MPRGKKSKASSIEKLSSEHKTSTKSIPDVQPFYDPEMARIEQVIKDERKAELKKGM